MPINVCQSLFSLFFTIFSKNLAKSLQRKEIKFYYFSCFVPICDSSLNNSLYYIDLLFSSLKLCLLNHKSPIFFLSFCPGLFDRVSMCVRVLVCWCVRSLNKIGSILVTGPLLPSHPIPIFPCPPALETPQIPRDNIFSHRRPIENLHGQKEETMQKRCWFVH